MSCRLFLPLFLLTALFRTAAGQSASSDTISLRAVTITGTRMEVFGGSQQITKADPATRSIDLHNDAGSFLSGECALFVKSYGPGGSATVTSRGMEARHTSVLWNGINVSSPSLGLTDLSLVPTSHFSELSFLHGGSSPVNGNSSLGGTLMLGQSPPIFERKGRIDADVEGGSFGMYNGQALVAWSDESIDSRTTLFCQSSDNDFKFTNTARAGHPEEKQQHADRLNFGIMQDLSVKAGAHQVLSAGYWYQVSHREIPPLMTAAPSSATAEQADTLLRCFIGWKRNGQRLVADIRAAWLNDRQLYTDEKQNLPYSYQTQTRVAEGSLRYLITRSVVMQAGVSAYDAWADFREYTKSQNRMSVSVFAGAHFILGDSWSTDVNIRREFTNVEDAPVVPSVGINGKIIPGVLHLSANVGRHYALPTMNDLYWVPGGNEHLKSEDAISGDLTLELFTERPRLPVISVTGYFGKVSNWIRWQPSAGGNYSPDNLREVTAGGAETSLKYTIHFPGGSLTTYARYCYTQAEVSSAEHPEEESTVGKQLMYTPAHMFNAQVTFGSGGFSVTYRHQFTGLRYTVSDESESLDPYQTGFLSISDERAVGTSKITFYARVHNLWNETYQVMAWYPTPGRWFSAGIHLDINLKI